MGKKDGQSPFPPHVNLEGIELKTPSGAVVALEKGFHASSAWQKCMDDIGHTTQCCVVVGTVKEGAISIGDDITIACNGKTLADKVVFLEQDQRSVEAVEAGLPLGICLQRTDAKNIGKKLAITTE